MKKKRLIGYLLAFCLLGLSGVAAAAAEPTQGDEKVQIFSIFGSRYDYKSDLGVTDTSSVFILSTAFRINDYVTGITKSEFHQWWMEDVDRSTLPPSLAEDYDENWQDIGYEAYVDGQYQFLGAKLGRFSYKPAYGLVHGDYQQVSGAQVSAAFKDMATLTLAGGYNTHYMGPFGPQDSTEFWAADLVVLRLIPDTRFKAAYMENDDVVYLEGGFDVKLPLDLSLEAAYLQSDADDDEIGYYGQVKYKNAIPFVGGTYDGYVQYHYLEANSIMGNDIPLSADLEGIRIGFHYVPVNNIQLWAFYDFADYITSGESQDYFRMQVDFFFDAKF